MPSHLQYLSEPERNLRYVMQRFDDSMRGPKEELMKSILAYVERTMELETENDKLTSENESLKARIWELEKALGG